MRRIKTFDYYRPSTLKGALSLLRVYDGEAKVLAGGTDLLISMKMKGQVPGAIINLKGIEKLKGASFSNGMLKIGALSTIHSLCNLSDKLQIPSMFATACGSLGTPQVRNIATVGGNLCNASPAADLSPSLLALEAKLRIVCPTGERTVPISNFFLGPGEAELRRNEILADIEIPVEPRAFGVYLKHSLRRSTDLAVVGVAVSLLFGGDSHRVKEASIALGAVAPTPIRARTAEGILKGEKISKKLIQRAARAAVKESKPISDVRASADYRKEMIRVLTERALWMAVRDYKKNR
ncbi:MAG: xanthine dehydrogenase family protein subunit M [Deltaproteobacteria bacterium]|nr:xanthine dehydrogenase family protein subunit M [Deltaproteobacteria bacterium]